MPTSILPARLIALFMQSMSGGAGVRDMHAFVRIPGFEWIGRMLCIRCIGAFTHPDLQAGMV
ncbi:MAG: hypothetical protein U9N61_12585 [Euryarchaeota archaeon]|nr:hypothetical protein [Euryarchaeota archaeon]